MTTPHTPEDEELYDKLEDVFFDVYLKNEPRPNDYIDDNALVQAAAKNLDKYLDTLVQFIKSRGTVVAREAEKAYGGCHNCYGKGYATQDSATIGYPDFPGDKGFKRYEHKMIFCSCERGKQLEQLTSKDVTKETTLQPFEVYNYKRLMALESRGIEEYRKLREAPGLTAEAVVSFINQLSPWNLETTGISVLNTYVEKQLTTTEKTE